MQAAQNLGKMEACDFRKFRAGNFEASPIAGSVANSIVSSIGLDVGVLACRGEGLQHAKRQEQKQTLMGERAMGFPTESRRYAAWRIWLALLIWLPASLASAESPDAATAVPFREGDVIGFDQIDKLKDYFPATFWDNRRFFFYEGMKLEIGPFQRNYAPAPEYIAATKRFANQVKLGPSSSLQGYVAGMAFDPDSINCEGDVEAGAKVIWNYMTQWEGSGSAVSFYYSYWDRGERMPLFYEGESRGVKLASRVEKEYLDGPYKGDVFPNENRLSAFGVEVTAPFDNRGTLVLSYRYKSSMNPPGSIKDDDMWVYVPSLRRVRRISMAQRTDAISGTDFTLDDINSFGGLVPEYDWKCLGEKDILAPVNTKRLGYPYNKDLDFGPYGLSFASDRWELRRAVGVRFFPKREDHPYHHKDIFLDKQTLKSLYSFAYDRKNELWKIMMHNGRWSEEDSKYYPGWEGVASPRDLTAVADVIVNVQTGTGNRIEFYDHNGVPMKNKAKIRYYIDVGRLTKGH